MAAFAVLALVGTGSAMLANAPTANASSSSTASGSASRSCPSGTVTGTVNATGIPGPNSSGHYQGLLFLTYQGSVIDQEISNAHGDVTFSFSTDAVPQSATSFTVNIQSPTQSGGVDIPVDLSVNTCGSQVQKPTVNLSISKTEITAGDNAPTLSWTSQHASSLTASGDWTGSKTVPGGSQAVPSSEANTPGTYTYTLTTDSNSAGQGTDSVTLTVDQPAQPKKVYVCKYVGKPGVDERLQTGQNPIDVSVNAIPENPVTIGSYFADAQGRSFVLAFDTGQPAPNVNECPAPQGPPPPPPCVTLSSNNIPQYGSLVWTGTSATVTLKQRDGGYCNDWTFDVTRYSPTDFPQTVQQVSAASVGKSGLSATASVDNTDCGQIDGYEGSGPAVGDKLNGPGQGYESNHRFLSQIFGGPNTWTVASDGCNTPPPPPTKVDVPAQPSVADACGPGNAEWNVPADTDSVVWKLRDDGHLIASTTPGYEFTDGTTSHDYGVAPDSNTPCPTAAQPKVDVSADSCVMPGATDGKTLITVTNTSDDTHATVEDYVVTVTSPGKTDVTMHTGPVADGASKTLTVLGLQPNTYEVAVTGSDMTGAGTSFVLTACQTPPPPSKTVVSVTIAATGANCGPKAIETYYVGGDLNKVTLVIKVAGKPVTLSGTDSFTVDSGQTWSVAATVKDASLYVFQNGNASESYSGKNAEKPFKCPGPPKHHKPGPPKHHPVPPTPPAPPSVPGSPVGPIPHTGFSGVMTPPVSHAFAWMRSTGLGFIGAGLLLGFVLFFRRKSDDGEASAA